MAKPALGRRDGPRQRTVPGEGGLAVLENALRARSLDRTLTTALPLLGRGGACVAPTIATEVMALDACLGGGLPCGQLSEIVGPRSSGRTLLLLQTLAAATRRGEIAALVDTFDRLDVASVMSAGVDVDRLLWIRGQAISQQLPPPQATEARSHGEKFDSPPCLRVSVARDHELLARAIERALKALNLVLQAGGFGVVALDLADVPPSALARIPFTTWLRVQRAIEGSESTCVLVAPQPLARSAGGVTVALAGRATWAGHGGHDVRPQASGLRAQIERPRTEAWGLGPGASFLTGMDITVRVVSPRRRVEGEVLFAATATDHGTPSHRGTRLRQVGSLCDPTASAGWRSAFADRPGGQADGSLGAEAAGEGGCLGVSLR